MFFKKSAVFIGIIFLFLLCSCDKIEDLEPRAVVLEETKVLAHRARGNMNLIRENTLEAAICGFNNLDGIEVDIAISKDNGFWLTHDSKVKSLDKYFIYVADNEIENIKDENNKPYYDKLEDVFQYMSDSAKNKTISLDVKYPFALFTGSVFSDAAEKISDMANEYGLQKNVLIESNSANFLKKITSLNKDIETYYMCFGDYEKGILTAYKKGLTGISFDYGRDDELTKEQVNQAHKLGLKVLVYTINNEEIKEVYPLEVDIIETDNMDFYTILHTP